MTYALSSRGQVRGEEWLVRDALPVQDFLHTLKDNQRTAIPVDKQSVDSAVGVIESAVKWVFYGDLPMRACPQNCGNCDFKAMCT